MELFGWRYALPRNFVFVSVKIPKDTPGPFRVWGGAVSAGYNKINGLQYNDLTCDSIDGSVFCCRLASSSM